MESNNHSLSIKPELLLIIITSITLLILNTSFLKDPLLKTICSIIIILVSGYGITLLFPLSPSRPLSFSRRLILSPILGIVLIGIWGLLITYTPLKSSHLTFQYVTIVIISLTFIKKIFKIYKSQKKDKKTPPTKKYFVKEDKIIKTARKAAESEKYKINSLKQKPSLTQHDEIEVLKIKQSSKDLFILLLVTVLTGILVFVPFLKINILKSLLIVPLLFFIPGYSILSFIFIKFQEQSKIKKIFGSIGVSTAISIGLCTIIYEFNLKIPSKTVLGVLIVISIVMAISSYLKRRKHHQKLKKIFQTKELSNDQKAKLEAIEYNIDSSSDLNKKSKWNYVNYIIAITFGIIGLSLSWTPFLDNTWIRALFIIPIIFILPGYSIKEFILAPKFSGKFSSIFISVFISILLTIMVGSLLELIYPSTYNYHYLCTSALSLITIIGILGAILKNKKYEKQMKTKTSEVEKPLSEKEAFRYPDMTSEIETEITEKSLKVQKPLKQRLKEPSIETGHEEKSLKPQEKTSSRFSFLKNDLFLIFVFTSITLCSIYIPELNKIPLREIFGLFFILIIPGYALTSAIFVKKSDLDALERIALSFGLSLAISPLIGLINNYTPYGIHLTPLIISLTILTIILGIIALLRRRNLSEDEKYELKISTYLNPLIKNIKKESKIDKILSIVLIICLVLAISTTAYIIVKPKQGEKFTEFYILGPNGKASDYPTNLTVGETGSLNLGVVNHEYKNTNYRYVVYLNGTKITDEIINLSHGQKLEIPIQITPNTSGIRKKLELILYKLPDEKNPYRSLHLWINVN